MSVTGNTGLGNANPFRYRGYYYDSETGLYYLYSRYYDPEVGRFINADDTDALLGDSISVNGKNLYAYCDNNPVNRKDDTGEAWLTILAGAVVGAVVNVATTYIAAKVTGQQYTLMDGLVAAGCGAFNSITGWGKWAAGLLSGSYTFATMRDKGASFGEALFCGGVSAFCTTFSVANLTNWKGDIIKTGITAVSDLTFGTGYNCVVAATTSAVTTQANTRKQQNQSIGNTRNTSVSKRNFYKGSGRWSVNRGGHNIAVDRLK